MNHTTYISLVIISFCFTQCIAMFQDAPITRNKEGIYITLRQENKSEIITLLKIKGLQPTYNCVYPSISNTSLESPDNAEVLWKQLKIAYEKQDSAKPKSPTRRFSK